MTVVGFFLVGGGKRQKGWRGIAQGGRQKQSPSFFSPGRGKRERGQWRLTASPPLSRMRNDSSVPSHTYSLPARPYWTVMWLMLHTCRFAPFPARLRRSSLLNR